MKSQNVGILHPGQMGVSIAASAQNSEHTIYWVSEGRSPETRKRAEKLGFQDAQTLAHLCKICSVIISVCPPDAAETVANQVLSHSFRGLYLDANAISPQRTRRIGKAMAAGGVAFVDGSIIGGPAWKPHSTWLYLSGDAAQQAAAYFSAGPLETDIVAGGIGKASALKMCFAAYTKGSTALLCAIVGAAESLGVLGDLERQWSRNGSDFAEQTSNRVRQVTAKAWRFAGEMDEISATFSDAGVPGEFHSAAARIYRRLAGFKDAPEAPSLEEVLEALLARDEHLEKPAG
jgi:3-hydroxyisobutyrate dehydrogenase-like beta-hydroxyacid dehydrogenase